MIQQGRTNDLMIDKLYMQEAALLVCHLLWFLEEYHELINI